MGPGPKRIQLFDCPIDSLNMEETLARVDEMIAVRKPHQHVVVNVSKIVAIQKDPDLQNIISSCDLINADGMPIVWASKLLGNPLPSRVAGIDLFQNLVQRCAVKGYRPFFFGAKEGVVNAVVERFKRDYPQLDVAGARNGYFNSSEENTIAEIIRESKADILFVAFPSPRKELFVRRWMCFMQVPFCMGVGGSFDIVAGQTKRAPIWMQKSGLEWFYRLIQEPGRMWSRYAKTNPKFVWMVLKEFLRRKIH